MKKTYIIPTAYAEAIEDDGELLVGTLGKGGGPVTGGDPLFPDDPDDPGFTNPFDENDEEEYWGI